MGRRPAEGGRPLGDSVAKVSSAEAKGRGSGREGSNYNHCQVDRAAWDRVASLRAGAGGRGGGEGGSGGAGWGWERSEDRRPGWAP